MSIRRALGISIRASSNPCRENYLSKTVSQFGFRSSRLEGAGSAFHANTAIVMSSGKGHRSRLYKTTDACRTWTLLFTNPDPEGFWDAVQAHTEKLP